MVGKGIRGEIWYFQSRRESRVATPHSAREGRGLVTFAAAACCTGISFTHIAQVPSRHNYLQKTGKAAACSFTIDLHFVNFLLKL